MTERLIRVDIKIQLADIPQQVIMSKSVRLFLPSWIEWLFESRMRMQCESRQKNIQLIIDV